MATIATSALNTEETTIPPNGKVIQEFHQDKEFADSSSSENDSRFKDGIRLEHINTVSREPGNANHEGNGGTTTYGEGLEDSDLPMTKSRIMSLVAMAILWVGSQIPLYLFGGVPPIIYADIGGADRWTWFVLGNLLALAAMCPFVGAVSDLIGRRYVALFGTSLVIIGQIVCSVAQVMNTFIAGMALSGAGAGINELTALAATSELAPVAKRGTYVAVLILTILPFAPSVLWAQLIADHGSWRYIGLLCAVWNFLGLLATFFFYYPPPRTNSSGLTNRQILQRVDWVGGLLSIVGVILFCAGLLWGGEQYTWSSTHVLAPMIIGAVFLVAFCFWEVYGTDYPMFPSRLKKDPRILGLTLVITFISGANFFAVLLFWPSQAYQVYGHDPIGEGLRGLPIGLGILTGAIVVLWLLSHFRGGIKWLMIGSSVLMTAGTGAIAAATESNLGAVYVMLAIAGLGIGGIVIPASIITTIVCPDDLIATVAAITLAIRVIGGAIGYTTYYNILVNKLKPNLVTQIGQTCIEHGIINPIMIKEIAELTSASLLDEIFFVVGGNKTTYDALVKAGQHAFALSYPDVYYASIAFGGVAIIASCFLGDISPYMDNHVAVIMH